MQKEIVQGIPFWKDKAHNLYSFESDKKLQIGTYNPATETYTLKEDWERLYEPRLTSYRENLNQRDRKENKVK